MMTNTNSFATAMRNEAAWGKTWNGADALTTTLNSCLDMFGRAGAMRMSNITDKQLMFKKAFDEDADIAMKLLFYVRDIRGGYGERDTFTDMLKWLANEHPDSVEKNLWAILEYGRAKDLYALIGTKSETAMWTFMKNQFELDVKNMKANNSISLLAKWIATPDASSEKTAKLGKKTAKMLGYDFKTMRTYKTLLRALRKYLDIPEAKMSTDKWSEIEYAKCASQCLIKHRNAFVRHDYEGYNAFIDKVNSGEVKMNTGAMTPCDIIREVANNYTPDLDTMWSNLEDYCEGNAMVMCDTSGSMTWGSNHSMRPIDVAIALSMYFAERNKGYLKDMFMTFESNPHLVTIEGLNLRDKYNNIMRADWGGSTNLEAAFDRLLNICKQHNVDPADMPEALIIISDMQINCVRGVSDNKITFYEAMSRKYEEAGYKLPQLVFWNVNAVNATFHASATQNGASLVSGYSPAVFKAVMDNIGKNPLDLLMEAVVNNERYAKIVA